MLSRVLFALSVVAVASAAATTASIVPPAQRGTWYNASAQVDLQNSPTTDATTIANAAMIVDQKATADGLPDQPVSNTKVTAVDGEIISSSLPASSETVASSVRRRHSPPSRRNTSSYMKIFDGTGTGPNDRDGSIEGTAYLTFTVVNNATYNVDACLAFCDSVEECVFANLFYEFNNPGLDAAGSNLKCAVYGDIHTAAEKTNKGGQQLAALPAGTTYIQQSSGYSSGSLVSPAPPEGYDLVFGPTNGANNAPGYMGFAFLDRYDVDACAALCNTRGSDSVGGACQYFNIWRAVVDGVPTTYTCSMYFIPADASTAVNTGQGNLQVTFSRGYSRKNLIIDGDFETFNACDVFCYQESYSAWIGTSPAGGTQDAVIFFYQAYAYTGNAVALLGAVNGYDQLPGTITPAAPLKTVEGKNYSIGFFHASSFSQPASETAAFVEVLWNGAVISTIRPGFSDWKFYQFSVTASGNDIVGFRGGAAPAWSFIDDITLFQI